MMPNNEGNPGAPGRAPRGDDDGFGKLNDHTAELPRPQLISDGDRLVALHDGDVIAWATLWPGGAYVHVVAPLKLQDPKLARFCQLAKCDPDTIFCVWGAL